MKGTFVVTGNALRRWVYSQAKLPFKVGSANILLGSSE